jgi:Bcr/CflA subfamily drug resistance transporter
MIYRRHSQLQSLELHQRYRIAMLAFFANIVSQLAIDLYTPSFPAMQIAFATSATNIKLTLATYAIGYGITQLLFGYLSDRYGRKKSVMTGYIGFLIATLLIIHCTNIYWFLAWRFLQGAMGGAFQVCMRCTFRDLFSGFELTKVSGYFSMLWSLIPLLGPLLGGYVQHYFGWHMQFKIILVLCGLFAILTWRLLPETRHKNAIDEANHFFTAIKQSLRNKRMLLFSHIVSLSAVPMMAYLTAAPFILQENFSLNAVTFGWLALLITGFNMLGAFFAARTIKLIGQQRMLLLMMLLCVVSALAFLIASYLASDSILSVLIPNAAIFFAIGALYPTAAGQAFDTIKKHIGVSVALFGTILLLYNSLAMGLIAILPHHSSASLAWLSFANSLIIATLVWRSGYRKEEST